MHMAIGQALPTIAVKTDSTKYLLGDKVMVKFEINNPDGFIIKWPSFLIDSGAIEMVEQSKIDTATFIYKKTVNFIPFDSGQFNFPSFIFRVQNGSQVDSIATAPFFIQVKGIVADTTKAFRPTTGALPIPYTVREILPYILMGIGVLLVLLLSIYLIKKYSKKKLVIAPKLLLPPDEYALNRLKILAEKKLVEQDKTKDFYSELTEIIREYIETRYHIAALESTTHELHQKIKFTKIDAVQKQQLYELLSLADYVKFAKAKPMIHDAEMHWQQAKQFINETKIIMTEQKSN
jgi:hypothetical protein